MLAVRFANCDTRTACTQNIVVPENNVSFISFQMRILCDVSCAVYFAFDVSHHGHTSCTRSPAVLLTTALYSSWNHFRNKHAKGRKTKTKQKTRKTHSGFCYISFGKPLRCLHTLPHPPLPCQSRTKEWLMNRIKRSKDRETPRLLTYAELFCSEYLSVWYDPVQLQYRFNLGKFMLGSAVAKELCFILVLSLCSNAVRHSVWDPVMVDVLAKDALS